MSVILAYDVLLASIVIYTLFLDIHHCAFVCCFYHQLNFFFYNLSCRPSLCPRPCLRYCGLLPYTVRYTMSQSVCLPVSLFCACRCVYVSVSLLSVCIAHCIASCLSVCLFVSVCMSRAADVLLAGAVINRVFQPHEVHIPYVLQVGFTFSDGFLRSLMIFCYKYIFLQCTGDPVVSIKSQIFFSVKFSGLKSPAKNPHLRGKY